MQQSNNPTDQASGSETAVSIRANRMLTAIRQVIGQALIVPLIALY
ncbi:hypothetical protein [Salinisphaera sp. Q1T1-3]|nr:hypothetical protein [Salinisphaera sp. Q1T1-3]